MKIVLLCTQENYRRNSGVKKEPFAELYSKKFKKNNFLLPYVAQNKVGIGAGGGKKTTPNGQDTTPYTVPKTYRDLRA